MTHDQDSSFYKVYQFIVGVITSSSMSRGLWQEFFLAGTLLSREPLVSKNRNCRETFPASRLTSDCLT